MALLEVDGLRTVFETREGPVRAVWDVSFQLDSGEILGLVGESGCGKSATALSILRLLPQPPARIVGGSIRFEGQDLLRLPEPAMRQIRGRRIGMIFQEPMTSLNPVFTVGYQIMEVLRLHLRLTRRQAQERAIALLRQVGIPDPERRIREYPHQLSGGMRQRVMIAMAVACEPALLIADEPTTALDVTVQAQILQLLVDLCQSRGMALLLISHDLGVVAQTTHRVIVMYAGRIVETASTGNLFTHPRHPYTLGLLRSLPGAQSSPSTRRLEAIPGSVPDLIRLPCGCTFHPRCPYMEDRCREKEPPLEERYPGHSVRCWFPR